MSAPATDKVREVIDRATSEIENKCPGLAGVWSCLDDAYDAWGDACSFAFAVNEVAYVLGVQCDPTFRPAPWIKSVRGDLDALATDDDWPRIEVIHAWQSGAIGSADLRDAVVIAGTLMHALDMAGVSY